MSTENLNPFRVIRPTGCVWQGSQLPFGGTIFVKKGDPMPKQDAFGTDSEYQDMFKVKREGITAMWVQHEKILDKRKK